jgi:hypothetical protein
MKRIEEEVNDKKSKKKSKTKSKKKNEKKSKLKSGKKSEKKKGKKRHIEDPESDRPAAKRARIKPPKKSDWIDAMETTPIDRSTEILRQTTCQFYGVRPHHAGDMQHLVARIKHLETEKYGQHLPSTQRLFILEDNVPLTVREDCEENEWQWDQIGTKLVMHSAIGFTVANQFRDLNIGEIVYKLSVWTEGQDLSSNLSMLLSRVIETSKQSPVPWLCSIVASVVDPTVAICQVCDICHLCKKFFEF